MVLRADALREAIRADEAAIESARASLDSDRSAIDRVNLDLSYCEIRSPVSGRAGNLLVHPGNLVKANDVERHTSRYLAYGARGLSVTLAVTVLADTAPTGVESGAEVGRTLLDAVFSADSAGLVARGRADLERRISSLIAAEQARALGLLDTLGLDGDASRQVRAAARRVDDRRFEQSRSEDEPQP